ncbi:MAG: DUF3667 domain-containing protein [Bacteroidaceae bacterium]|nr:DUF3667 domain-containing protein [Bacteroidaceae bacterium]
MKRNRHSIKVRLRAFRIWQVLGYNPWKSEWTVADDVPEGNVKGFYRGAFDSIPFLNDDAKRTFVHLLLRPGYMIRDYIKGKHELYLAPLTSLIIFYAFFSLVSSIAHPEYKTDKASDYSIGSDSVSYSGSIVNLDFADVDSAYMAEINQHIKLKTDNLMAYLEQIDILMHLDSHPEAVDSPKKASLAAFESALRSQGLQYFLGIFLLLWPAMRIVLRKQSMGWAASATTAAYVLCQFSFFMLFVLILSFGQKNEIGAFFGSLLIMIDYRQLFGISYGKSFWLTVKTLIYYMLFIGLQILLLSIAVAVYMFI